MKTIRIICRVLATLLVVSSLSCFYILLFQMENTDLDTRIFLSIWFLLTGGLGVFLYYKTYRTAPEFDSTVKPKTVRDQYIYIREVISRAKEHESELHLWKAEINGKEVLISGICRIIEVMYYRNLISLTESRHLATVVKINAPLQFTKKYHPWYFPLNNTIWKKARICYMNCLIHAYDTCSQRRPPSFSQIMSPLTKLMSEYEKDNNSKLQQKTIEACKEIHQIC